MSAAKQGLSAQISQASEDAKRAVLNRTSLTTSLWFSNLNTTCTIKSAPPRTPEVLSLLSTKSGWLFKRNEQHVWQTRWCCVVPHTFLYYFDANVLPGEAQPPVPSVQQQDDWNHAVSNGYSHRHNRKQPAPRSSLYLFPHRDSHNSSQNDTSMDGGNPNGDISNAASPTHSVHPNLPHNATSLNPTDHAAAMEAFSTMQPAGIIDLECYTSVHRSAQNQLVLELAGDDAVNPDLRQFYFTAGSEQETEAWTQALLGQRHSALMDETDAYKQVCDGFAQQLQMLHSEMDRAQKQAEDASEELYQVRSEMEDGRRSCWKLVEEVLDRHAGSASSLNNNNNKDDAHPTLPASSSFRADLDAIRSQDMSLLAPVQLLSDYTRQLEDSCHDLTTQNRHLQEKLHQTKDSDQDQVAQLQAELAEAQAELARQQSQWSHEKQVLQQKLDTTTKELDDTKKDLASNRMEVTMFQSSTRNKITELQNHKKILKKEVLDLRHKLEEAQSQLSIVQHKEKTHQMEVDQERKKAELLERYVDKMESQVKVQQNMMEMMSASGVGSVHGGPASVNYEVSVPRQVHSPRSTAGPYEASPSRRNIVLMNTPSNVGDDKHAVDLDDNDVARIQMPNANGGVAVGPQDTSNVQDDDDEEDDDNQHHHLSHHHHHSQLLRRNQYDDSDNKSHMSELTEDRTQKQFDALQYLRETRELRDRDLDNTPTAARIMRYASPQTSSPSPQAGRAPPTYIVGGNNNSDSKNYSSSLHQQQLLQNFQNPENAKLGTIHSSATAVTTPNRVLSPELNLPRGARHSSNLPPHQVTLDGNNSNHYSNHHSSSKSLGAGTPGRLSVAQRSRLQAESRTSTPVKIRLDSADLTNSGSQHGKQQLQRQRQETQQTRSPTRQHISRGRPERRPSTSSQRSGSIFSAIGRKLEAAIDKTVFAVDMPSDEGGIAVDDDDLSSSNEPSANPADPSDEDSNNDRNHHNSDYQDRHGGRDLSSPRRSALLTQENLDGTSSISQPPTSPIGSYVGSSSVVSSPTRSQSKQKVSSPSRSIKSSMSSPKRSSSMGMMSTMFGTPRRVDSSNSLFSDEKKTPTPDRVKTMTLQERQQLQRQKQLQFLKDQGLIKDEADVKGGAGAASPSFDGGSVTSGAGGSLVSTPRRFR